MTIRTHHVIYSLDKRIAWLGSKLNEFEDRQTSLYNFMAQEKAALVYARNLVQREQDFIQRLKVEDRFTVRNDDFYNEFISEVCK